MKFLQIVCVILLCQLVAAQKLSCADIENDLVKASSKVSVFYQNDLDSLDLYSPQFDKKINQYIKENPETLHCPFKTLVDSNACFVTTSADKRLRIYSWDTWMGGTMHQFKNIYQYQSGTTINSETSDYYDDDTGEDGYDPGTFCSAIYTLTAQNKTYYLVITNGIYSTKDCSQTVECYAIEDGKLNKDVKLFKTREGMTSEINFYFDFFTVVDRPERPLKLIRYDETKKTLSIPIVYENGKVTDRFIVYKFNGKYFERIVSPKKKG